MKKISLVELSKMENKPEKVSYDNCLHYYWKEIGEYIDNDGFNIKAKICLKDINIELIEYEEEILTEKEKEYLKNVIKPFRNKIEYICVQKSVSDRKTYNHIRIEYLEEDSYYNCFELPMFIEGTMYNGMEIEKYYSLEDLNL